MIAGSLSLHSASIVMHINMSRTWLCDVDFPWFCINVLPFISGARYIEMALATSFIYTSNVAVLSLFLSTQLRLMMFCSRHCETSSTINQLAHVDVCLRRHTCMQTCIHLHEEHRWNQRCSCIRTTGTFREVKSIMFKHKEIVQTTNVFQRRSARFAC